MRNQVFKGVLALGVGSLGLAACATVPPISATPRTQAVPIADAPVLVEAPPPPVEPVCLAREDVPHARRIRTAMTLLDEGDRCHAKAELQAFLAVEPDSGLAKRILWIMETDPFAYWGPQSETYRVGAGETLSIIARDRLGDPFLFPLLARYNDLAAPNSIARGDVLRIPTGEQARADYVAAVGRPPEAEPEPVELEPEPAAVEPTPVLAVIDVSSELAEGLAAERADDPLSAYRAYSAALEKDPNSARAANKVVQMAVPAADVLHRRATEALREQKPEQARALWTQTLEVNPEHPFAARGLRQAEALINRIEPGDPPS
ncbi:MAG: hypothetical protein ACFB2Z_00630 [Maricaulaceae bacterium]